MRAISPVELPPSTATNLAIVALALVVNVCDSHLKRHYERVLIARFHNSIEVLDSQ